MPLPSWPPKKVDDQEYATVDRNSNSNSTTLINRKSRASAKGNTNSSRRDVTPQPGPNQARKVPHMNFSNKDIGNSEGPGPKLNSNKGPYLTKKRSTLQPRSSDDAGQESRKSTSKNKKKSLSQNKIYGSQTAGPYDPFNTSSSSSTSDNSSDSDSPLSSHRKKKSSKHDPNLITANFGKSVVSTSRQVLFFTMLGCVILIIFCLSFGGPCGVLGAGVDVLKCKFTKPLLFIGLLLIVVIVFLFINPLRGVTEFWWDLGPGDAGDLDKIGVINPKWLWLGFLDKILVINPK